jgi:peptide-methionine (S)-S-oxide reductase
MAATRNTRSRRALLILAGLLLLGASAKVAASPAPAKGALSRGAAAAKPERAVFAMGCFWCAEATFEGKPGVLSVVSGYSGGDEKNPTYEEVSAGRTHHRESIEVTFDPAKISYPRLLAIFWHNVDPTQSDGQFCDHGAQYRAALFPMSETQRSEAEASKERWIASRRFRQPIVTDILPFKSFWPAEEYHQDYYRKNPVNYHSYRLGCGRDKRLRDLWGAETGGH